MKFGFHKLTALILVLAMMVPFLTACKEEPVNLQEVYKFSETAVTLNAGENYALLVYDDTYSDRAYTAAWSSDNPAVVSVEQSGFITALSAGSANVTATLTFAEEQQTVTLTCAVTVLQTVVNVTGISLNAMEQTLDVGGVTVLTATVLPDDATNKAVSWASSNPAVAIVSSGVVTAVGAGTAIITAVTEDGAKTAECVITVNQPVDVFESLTLNRTSTSINVGKTVSLTATVKPTGVAADIIWTSGDESIATVVNGTVTGVSAGTTTITATLNDKVTTHVATCKVTVKTASSSSGTTSSGNNSGSSSSSGSTSTTVKATSVKFDVQSITIYVGQTGPWKFNATVTPSNTTEKGTWSSSEPSVASVDSNGNITIGDIGNEAFKTTTITYKVGSKSANGVVVVMAEKHNPNKDESGSNTGTGTGTGTNTGDSTNTGTNTGTNDDGTKKITDLILAESKAEILIGEVYALEFDAYPKDAVESYTWTSGDESIVTVTSAGVITGKKAGTAKVTITGVKSGIKDDCVVTVKEKTAESIMVSPTSVNLTLGQTAKITANLTPGDATDTITWSSQYPSIVSVDQNGNVTALQSGTVNITAKTSTGKTATCVVFAGITGSDSGGSTGVPTNKIKVSVYVGASGDLKAGSAYSAYLTFSPSLSAAQLSTLMYAINSSNSSVASVNRVTENDYTKNSFTIVPGVDGTATLTGFVNSSDSSLAFEFEPKTVVVSSPDSSITNPITSITMAQTTKSMYAGEKATLVASASYYTSGSSTDVVTWSSSDESVVRVNGSGLTASIEAVKAGTATITIKSKGNLTTNNRTATCKVTVNSTGSVDSTRGIIAVSQSSTYTPTNADIGISGTPAIAPYWTSNSTVVSGAPSLDASYILSIDANGLISVGSNVPIGTSLSTAVRYVDSNNTLVTRDFTIMVLNAKNTSSSSSTASVNATATVAQTGNISNQYSFANAVYESNNTNVITVHSTTGEWTAVGKGYATVTVKSADGKEEYLKISFTVDYATIKASMSTSSTASVSGLLGTAAVGKNIVSVTASNTSLVTIINNYQDVVTNTSTGTVRLTVYLKDNETSETSNVYVDLSVGYSSSSSSNAKLTASYYTITGGSSVNLSLTGATAYSNVVWECTAGGTLTATGANSTDGFGKASAVLNTTAVTSSTTITVYATVNGSTIVSVKVTVNP